VRKDIAAGEIDEDGVSNPLDEFEQIMDDVDKHGGSL
jgi:hypothetical protein